MKSGTEIIGEQLFLKRLALHILPKGWKTIENCSFQLSMNSENPILWIYGNQMSKDHTVALQNAFGNTSFGAD